MYVVAFISFVVPALIALLAQQMKVHSDNRKDHARAMDNIGVLADHVLDIRADQREIKADVREVRDTVRDHNVRIASLESDKGNDDVQ
jgi:hypothetical protein